MSKKCSIIPTWIIWVFVKLESWFHSSFRNLGFVRLLDDLHDRYCYLCISEAWKKRWWLSVIYAEIDAYKCQQNLNWFFDCKVRITLLIPWMKKSYPVTMSGTESLAWNIYLSNICSKPKMKISGQVTCASICKRLR